MGLAFLAPIFLAGFALLAAPWIIHRIRRPERETTRFSSLMFVPKIRKEIIERRRLQHILLMLMRMAMLALLAFAFARPYWRAPAAAPVVAAGAAWHVVLLDTSYSMGVKGWFEDAKAKARAIADSLNPSDRVGVIAFARAPKTAAALFSSDDPDAGSPASARRAIDSAQLTEEATAYVPALQAAQAMLGSAETQMAARPARLVVHLISDFQRAGMPDKANRWKLEPQIELKCIDVSQPQTANCAIEDVSVREAGPGELRVLGKIRNWSSAPETSRTIKLMIADKEQSRNVLTIAPGAARQVSFRVPIQAAANVEGWLELDGDALEIDNRRYFAWQSAGKRRVLLLTSKDQSQPGARFLSSALPPESDLPWRLEIQPPAGAAEILSNAEKRPSILIVEAVDSLTPEIRQAIRRYVETGGRALFTLDGGAAANAINEQMLAAMGVRSGGPRFPEKRETRFALMSWVDFDHPVFFPLRGPQFNDFSGVRFYNSQRLTLLKPEGSARVIARFEADADGNARPAMIEWNAGRGRAILWAFGTDLEWSNLPRSVKFIPLLYETLSYLGGGDDARRAWLVGEPLQAPKGETAAAMRTVQLPGENDSHDLQASSDIRARRSGFASWLEAQNRKNALVEAVNIPAGESNPEHLSAEEFQMKLGMPRVEPERAASLDLERGVDVGGFAIHREYWRIIIGILLLFFFVESWHAATLVR